jgi:hypothetical protein
MTTEITKLDEETTISTGEMEVFLSMVSRLNKQSVEKHFEAYVDVDWDNPEYKIDPSDPAWKLPEDDPLGGTEWYRNLDPEIQARIGLERVVTAAKIGLQFENVLKRGLLEFAFKLDNNDPSFRYVMHEITEECQHSMMFQELVNRSGIDVKGLSAPIRFAARFVTFLGAFFPELFFLFVLGGEDPIDYVQRQLLKRNDNHPLLERIMRIHVTEEARHLSFARNYLKMRVPKISAIKRFRLSISAPVLLGIMALQMLYPSRDLIKEFKMPRSVIKEAYKNNPEAKQVVKDSVAKVRKLCYEIGLINPVSLRLWKLFGIWQNPQS